ncbi:MAG: cytochrome c biogenesis CcdA family protein [Chloroflexota bacterium]
MIELSIVGLAAAFVGGLLSFLSPCVAPLMPGYLALISGNASSSSSRTPVNRHPLFITSLVFVAGFSLVFIALGAAASVFGNVFFSEYRQGLARVAGVVMIAMGLILLWGFRLPFFSAERKFHIQPRKFTHPETLLLGMAFGFGWTPCFGPILASILTLSSTVDGVRDGTVLLAAYSMGLGVPFLLLGLGLSRTRQLLNALNRHMGVVVVVSGVILVGVGALFASGQVFRIALQTQVIVNNLIGLNLG